MLHPSMGGSQESIISPAFWVGKLLALVERKSAINKMDKNSEYKLRTKNQSAHKIQHSKLTLMLDK